MKLEILFEKFDQFPDGPDAIRALREVVLQLAVRGKLTDQRSDESARSQLELSEDFRIRHGRRRGSAIGEVPFEVPQNWHWVAVGDTMTMINGKAFKPEEWSPAGTPIIRIQNLNNKTAAFNYCNVDLDPKIHVHTGDFLISWSGTPGTSFGAFIWDRGFAYLNQHIFRCELVEGVFVKEFLRLTINARLDEMISHAQGAVGLRHITKGKLESIRLPLPPFAEQKRIVAKVDELMALCVRLETQQQKQETLYTALASASLARFAEAPTPANLNFIFHKSYDIAPSELRKSILSLAVQGKLVPQNPKDTPALELLAEIADDVARAVRAKRMRNSKPVPAYEAEFPFCLPPAWEWAPLGTLTAAEDGAMCDGPFGSKLKTEHYIETKGYAVVRLGNIGVGYFIRGKEGHISREHFESLSSNHTAPGDLLVAGLADPLVRCCEIPPDLGPAVNKSDCFRLRLHNRMDRSYVRHYLNSPVAKAFASEENHGMTRERINLASAKALPVAVPPIAEQHRIVAKVDKLMALVDQLESHLAASRAAAAKLLDALVAELTGKT